MLRRIHVLRRWVSFISVVLCIIKIVILPEFEIVITIKLIFETVKSLLCESEITLDFEASWRTALTNFLRNEGLLRIFAIQFEFFFFNGSEFQCKIELFSVQFSERIATFEGAWIIFIVLELKRAVAAATWFFIFLWLSIIGIGRLRKTVVNWTLLWNVS